jgi:sterol desaturase/sphingolipid hydroxylase (fatty acid hydroxylase superfamily)
MDRFLAALQHSIVDLAPFALIFAAIAAVTKQRGAIAAMLAARRETSTNVGLFLFNKAIWLPLIAVPLIVFQNSLQRITPLAHVWTPLSGLVLVLIAVVVIDFGAYWRHRLEHSPELWRVHATHHADEEMGWFTVHRKHPLGEALAAFCDLVPVLLLGLPVWAIVAAMMLRSWWGYLIHADVPWTLGPLGKVLISPAAHRLHHIRDEALMGSNYGNTLTLWDRLFGTYIDPAPYVNCETGIAEGTRSLRGELLRPFEARYWRRRRCPGQVDRPAT